MTDPSQQEVEVMRSLVADGHLRVLGYSDPPLSRGRCVVCLRSVRLRLDGTVGSHQHWIFPCGGTGHAPAQEESK